MMRVAQQAVPADRLPCAAVSRNSPIRRRLNRGVLCQMER